MKYVLRLNDDTANNPAKLEVLKDDVGRLGARNIEVHGMGLVMVDSEVPLNFAAVQGVEGSQEVKETGRNAYVLALNDDADPKAVEDAVTRLGAANVKYHDTIGIMTVDSNVQLDVAELSALTGVKHARPEQTMSLVRPVG